MTTLIRFAIACAAVPIGLTAQSATEARSSKNPSLEQRVRALEDKEAILKVMYQYAYTIDFGHDVNEYTDLYTDDALSFRATRRRTLRREHPPGKAGVLYWVARGWRNGSQTSGRDGSG